MTDTASELRVYADPAAVARALAELVVELGRDAIARRGTFAVALAGGTTPKAAYQLLGAPPLSNALDWSLVQVFFGDERCVPPDDDRSNYKTADDAFLKPAGVPAANVHRMRGEDDPDAAAEAYRAELISALGARPHFDLVLLGMGNDGHTASLFPGADPMTDSRKLVRAVYSDAQQQWRITLTPDVLNAAHTVAFAVEGAAKTAMLQRVRDGAFTPVELPSQIIRPAAGNLIWLVDRAAAGIPAP